MWTVLWVLSGECSRRYVLFYILMNCRRRNEITSCEEMAYDSLPLKDAATLLFFTSRNDLIAFAQQVSFCISIFASSGSYRNVAEGLASEPSRGVDHVQKEGRGKNIHPNREANLCEPSLRTRIRADRLIVLFLNSYFRFHVVVCVGEYNY